MSKLRFRKSQMTFDFLAQIRLELQNDILAKISFHVREQIFEFHSQCIFVTQ